jgi:mannose-1-phosphate guanylyltransferase
MKAFLMAAGMGTRLKPLTDNIPKCLVPINGKPLLAWWFDLLEKHNVDEVLINLHYLPILVENFVKTYPTKVKINFVYEKELKGSAGTLLTNKEFVKDEKCFYILYADNLTNINLQEFLAEFEKSNHQFGMALFRSDNPESCGIVELNETRTIINFEEKPKNPKSNLANAGIYLASPEILELIPIKNVADIGFDLLPKLVNKMFGYETKEFFIDIGTYKNLETAEKNWKLNKT